MLKFASAASCDALRGLVAEFYYSDKSQIVFENGAIYKNGQKMTTEYIKKGGRWYFVKKQ